MNSKVCFFNLAAYSLFYPKSKFPIGGTEVQLFNLSKYFSCEKEVFFVIGDCGQKMIERRGRITLYKSSSLDKRFVNYLKAPFLIWKSLKKINADIYIASSAGIEIGIVAFFCRMYGKKFIYRTASVIDCNREFIRKNGFRGRLYRYGLESAHAVVAQNEENKSLLKENHGIDSVVIKNSFVINDESKVGIVKKEFILWVGRTEPNKQPEIFLEMAQKFPNERFVMIAPKQNHLVGYFEEIVKKANVIQNVTFLESVPFDQIQDYFNMAKLLICTSEYEGFPNVHLQAYMGGTPVVTLNINPDNYIVKNDIGGFANGSTDLLEREVRDLLVDKDVWEKKSKNSYEYVKNNHDISIIGRQWDDLISIC